jgi:Bacterial Ig domain/Domain of unknown function (DUF4214)
MIYLSRRLPKGRGFARRARDRRRLMINLEALETRTVLSNVSVTFPAPGTASTLLIQGDQFNDNFTITELNDGTVTVAPGAMAFKPGVGIIAPSTINANAAAFNTQNPVSAIVVQLPGTNNFDIVNLNSQSGAASPTVGNVTVTATGANLTFNVGVTGFGVHNSGFLNVSDTASTNVNGVLNDVEQNSSFASQTVTQFGNGPDSSSVTMTNDVVPGRVLVTLGNANNDSISLTSDTFGPTTLIEGNGGPANPVAGSSLGNSDTITVTGGKYQTLFAQQKLDGTRNTISISNIMVAYVATNVPNPAGVTTIQGNGAFDTTTITGVTTYVAGITQNPPPPGVGLANIRVTQGTGAVGLVVNPNGAVNDQASVQNSNVPGFISISQSDVAGNSPMYNTALISGDTAGGSLSITQGNAGGVVIESGVTPGDQASIHNSTSGGNATISQGSGINDSATIDPSTIGGNASITQADVAGNPGDQARINGDTVTGSDTITQGAANGDLAQVVGGTAGGNVTVIQLGGNSDVAQVSLTSIGGNASITQGAGNSDVATLLGTGTTAASGTIGGNATISQGAGNGDTAVIAYLTIGGSIGITQLGGGDDSATITGLTATGGTDTVPIVISIGQGGGDGDMATITGLTAPGGTDTVPIVISIGQGGGSGDTSAMTDVNTPYGNISITQGDVGTSTVGDTASVLNVTVGTGATGIEVNGGVTVVQGSAPGDVALVQGGSSNDIAITQGDNVQVPDGGSVASDVAEINGTNVMANITIAQGTGNSTLDNAGHYVTAIGFDYLGLINGDAASSPVTAGFETDINQNYANNQLFLGDPSNGSSFVTTFLDAFTGNGGGAFIQAANTTVYLGPLTGTFSITGVSPGSSYLDAGGNSGVLVTTTDAAGTTAGTEDSIPPASPVVTSPSTAISISTSTATITGTAEAGSLVQIYQGGKVVASEQLSGGATTYILVAPLVQNAANLFTVTATDAAGNQSSPAAVPTVTEDSIAPGVPAVSAPLAPQTVNATTYTITGTAKAGSLVQIYSGNTVVGTLQLNPGQTSYSITIPLIQNAANHFLVTASDAAGNQSPPVMVPTITTAGMVRGTIYHDLNANGLLDAGEPGLAGRVVFLDLKNDGTLDAGDPTSTTDASGNFSFPGYVVGSATVLEATAQDSSNRYVVDQTTINPDGSVSIGVVPFSPVAPVPVVPSPFSASPNPDANTAYIQSLYRAVLGRTGRDSEVASWLGAMNSGMTSQAVALGFVNSLEHRQDQVRAFYQEFLHRAPDPASAYWVNALRSGVSEETVAEGILNSAEYQRAHQDPALFIHDLYIDVLGRQGEPTGVAAWNAVLASGLSRQAIEADFVQSIEASHQIVNGFYAAYLHRPAEVVESDAYVTMLEAPGGSATDVALDILASSEFDQDAVKPGS